MVTGIPHDLSEIGRRPSAIESPGPAYHLDSLPDHLRDPIVLDGENMAPKWLPKWLRIDLGQKMMQKMILDPTWTHKDETGRGQFGDAP